MLMPRTRKIRRENPSRRSGSPFTLYLRRDQAARLERLARGRHVAKSELVRVAIDRLLAELEKGHSAKPIGLDS